jgi:ABC-type multidrug transport system fused ATPase/permease subunit
VKTLRLLLPYWPWLLLALGLALVPAIAQAALPELLVRPLFSQVLAQARYGELGSLLAKGGFLLGLIALGSFSQETLMGYLAVRVPKELRERLYERLMRADLAQLAGTPASLSGRILADLREVENFIFYGLGGFLIQSLTLIALLGQMLWHYPRLSLYLALLLPWILLILGGVGHWVSQVSQKTQAGAERVAGRMAEGFGRLELIQAMALETYARLRFAKASEQYYRLGRRRGLISALSLPLSQMAVGAVLVILLFIGVSQVRSGHLSVGGLTAYLTLLALSLTPIQVLAGAGTRLAQAEGAAQRLAELEEVPLRQWSGTYRPNRLEGVLELRNLSFAYPGGTQVLKGVSAQILPGQLTALVGPSGAGKSTLLRLLLTLYLPQEGSVLLDGRPFQEYDLTFLRQAIAWVPQEPLLFGGSVEENLRAFAPQADREAMRRALAQVHLAEELTLETSLEEEGRGISVGQRQRLALAGALLREAPILLLDEVTSALDPLSESRVLETLEELRPHHTLFVVAHRLSTVRHADRILVLSEGRLVESGSHDELLARGGVYATLWELA